MTDEEIAKARALCDVATPGEWHCYHHEGYGWRIDGERVGILSGDWNEADGDFIAAARTLLPAALEALEAARRERDKAIAKAANYERDWYAAKSEFGTARGKLTADLAATKAALAEAMGLLRVIPVDSMRCPRDVEDRLAAALKAEVQP